MDRFPEPHFQCPRCGLGDFEVGQLTRPDEPFCLVCQEEDGELIRRGRREQADFDQARFRVALLAD